MPYEQIKRIRHFDMLMSRRTAALSSRYLSRGRPLGEARLLFEVGQSGIELGSLRAKLNLDSGHLSRLLRSLERQGLLTVVHDEADRRRRNVMLTPEGREEAAANDRLSNELAESILVPLRAEDRSRLVRAVTEVERLLGLSDLRLDVEDPESRDAVACRETYFAELASRFEGGFDGSLAKVSRDQDMRRPNGAFVVARLNGEAVGCGGFTRIDAGVAELKRLWTAPGVRGMGVGRRLLQELEQLARDAGYRTIRLDTNRALSEAQAFYRREGYRDIERYNDNPYGHFFFEKTLT